MRWGDAWLARRRISASGPGCVKTARRPLSARVPIIPAQAGIQGFQPAAPGSRLRGATEIGGAQSFHTASGMGRPSASRRERPLKGREPTHYRRGSAAIRGPSLAINCCGSPAIPTHLLRLAAPARIARSRRGRRHSRASNCSSSSFARPSCAGAVAAALTAVSLPVPDTTATSPLSRARGVRRTRTRTPSAERESGSSGKVFEHQVADEPL
jgi:hypothetical protein